MAVAVGLALLGPSAATVAAVPTPASQAPVAEGQPPGAGVLDPVSLGAESGPITGRPLRREPVTATLRPLLRGGSLGPGRSPAHVIDVATGAVLYSASPEPTVPASTMKLVTATSALDSLGPDQRLRTHAALITSSGRVPQVVLVGAGDPSLRSAAGSPGSAGGASLAELAAATAQSLEQRGFTEVRIGYDDSLFTGRSLHPSWSASFPADGVVAPVSALQVDQGRASPTSARRVPDPAARAGQVFAAALRDGGVSVRGVPRQVTAPIGSTTLAFVASPPVGVLVERTLEFSDNDYAESLGRLGAAGSGESASFAGVARRAEGLLRQLGVRTRGARFADASGLSRRNRLQPSTLTDLLRVTATGYGALHSGLPVAAATGSLAARFRPPDQRAGRGVVRAKTGTLTSVVGLAGYASRPDGRLLAFAFLDDSATGGTPAARAAFDLAASKLVSCRCVATADAEPGASGGPAAATATVGAA